MKRLTKVRLVHWYHIQDETLSIDGSALFMGDNGSGKSTILDAIQFALVADLNQIRFNQAANDQAARSLQGYTRWMVNSGGSKESNEYNRGDCTSYVLLEFSETLSDGPTTFTVGVAIDSYKDGRDPKRLHFAINRQGTNDIVLYKKDSRFLLNTSEFRRLMATQKGFFGSYEPGAFRDDLLIRLGKLSPDFTKVLVKAQAFKPLGHVQQFVMDFLLDARPLETKNLQENLGHYKSLEQKALEAKARISQLSEIESLGKDLSKAQHDRRVFRYLELRSEAGASEEQLELTKIDQKQNCEKLSETITEKSASKQKREDCEQELGSVYRVLASNSAYQEQSRIKADIDRTDREYAISSNELRLLESNREELAGILKELPELATELPDAIRQFSIQKRVEKETISSEVSLLKVEGQELQARLSNLKKGIRPYPKEAMTLKQLIEDQLGEVVPFFCDLIDVQDEKWQDAVEGYLNTRRFDLIPPPKLFQKCVGLYEKHKRQLNIHGVGLVDSEKMLATAKSRKSNALSQVVVSDNLYARAYADFTMGDLIRCESEQDLRNHHRSITPTCMIYQNHTARQTPFHIYNTWHIGQRGQAKLILQTQERLNELHSEFTLRADRLIALETLVQRLERAEKLERSLEQYDLKAKNSESMKAELERLAKLLASIDISEVKALEEKELKLRTLREQLDGVIEKWIQLEGQLQERSNSLELTILSIEQSLNSQYSAIANEYPIEESTLLNKRYLEERQKREPSEICEIFISQRKSRETRINNLLLELTQRRTEYNNQFGYSAPVQGEDLTPYSDELKNWTESHLPNYEAKILKAKESALQQLMEDIVHKLRENLDLIPNQFDQINRALKGFHFGHDQYQFTYQVKRDYQAFEKMIREAAQYESQPLFETNWRERFRDGGALEALFSNMVSGTSARVEEELKQYSDYREYYDYDLKILHADGTSSLFSQVSRLKSGGETQAPYYIAILASLHRLYRLGNDPSSKQRGTIGLVLLDEAFNKMDEDRLKATLEFTRRLGLQLIMATPKERAEFIIPHVETCWLVSKDPQSGVAFLHDFHQSLPNASPPEA